MRRISILILTLATALAPVAAQTMPPAPPRVAEGFLSHQAIYDLTLKNAVWSSNITGLSGRLVTAFDDACQGYTFNQRLVTQYVDSDGKSTASNFWISSYETADGNKYRFMQTSTTGTAKPDRSEGDASRDSHGASQVAFQGPNSKTINLPKGVVFPTELMGKTIAAARAGQKSFSVKIFEGDIQGKVYDVFVSIGPQRAATADELAVPGGDVLKGQSGWAVAYSYYPPGNDDLPEYETDFTLFENGVSSDVTLDYGQFALIGHLVKIDKDNAPSCGG